MEPSGLRRRKPADFATQSSSNDALHTIKSMDVFSKVPEDFKEPTKCGGALTVICITVTVLLVLAEFVHYRTSGLEFSYSVDKDFSSKLPLSIDVTVAMPCHAAGADIVDLVNENIDIDGGLNEEDAYFDLTPEDDHKWKLRRMMNNYISEEYHALHKVLWTTGYRSSWAVPGPRKLVYRGNRQPDACRFFGLVHVKKMAGNFHILAGKALHGMGLHAHISLFASESDSNFSHRIDRLAFGSLDVAIVNPLDGEERITKKNSVSYQYNLKVVPTEVTTWTSSVMTYQYGVQAMERVLNHSSGSHGIPGIFIKYDINPLKISVSDEQIPMIHFLVRVCGIVGGIFATTGVISTLLNHFINRIFGRHSQRKIPFYKQDSVTPSGQDVFDQQNTLLPNALFTHLDSDSNNQRI